MQRRLWVLTACLAVLLLLGACDSESPTATPTATLTPTPFAATPTATLTPTPFAPTQVTTAPASTPQEEYAQAMCEFTVTGAERFLTLDTTDPDWGVKFYEEEVARLNEIQPPAEYADLHAALLRFYQSGLGIAKLKPPPYTPEEREAAIMLTLELDEAIKGLAAVGEEYGDEPMFECMADFLTEDRGPASMQGIQ